MMKFINNKPFSILNGGAVIAAGQMVFLDEQTGKRLGLTPMESSPIAPAVEAPGLLIDSAGGFLTTDDVEKDTKGGQLLSEKKKNKKQ